MCASIYVFFACQVWFDNTGYVSMVAYMNVISNMLFRASLSHDVDPVTAGITVINHPLNRTHYQMARHLLYDHVSFLLLNLSRLQKPFRRFFSSFSQCIDDILRIITVFVITESVLSKVDDFATFKKVEVHAENSTF